MKKLFVSAGLIAASAASIQTAVGDGLDIVSPKAWSVSASLRGFYDDNYNIAGTKKGSAGAEVSPTISYNLPLQQTDMGIRYIYGLYYYQDRQDLHLSPFDQTHQVDVWLDHAINERWHLNITDTFAVGQEPGLLTPATLVAPAVPYRVNGDNLANHANITLETQWTREFSTSVHYGNDFYDYDNSGGSASTTMPLIPDTTLPVRPMGTPGIPGFSSLGTGGASLSGLLDRDEQNVGLNLDWTFSPETKVFAGYTFSWVNYVGGEPIAVYNYNNAAVVALPVPHIQYNPKSIIYRSDSRNSITHEVHVGIDHSLTSNLSIMASIGAAYTDSYNDPLQNTTQWSPTANVTASYTYSPGSYVQLGVSQGQNSTDVVQPGTDGSITQYQNSTVVFADVNHRITQKLMGTLIGRYTYSTFEGGANNSEADNDFNVGVNLSYQINRHFSAEIGYNYDDLQSDVAGRTYSRNRVYLGLGANY